MLDEGWPITVKKSVSGTTLTVITFPPSFLHQTCCPLHLYLSRSSSLKTAVRMMCVQQTWCCRLIWTSLGQGTHFKNSPILFSFYVSLTRSDIYSIVRFQWVLIVFSTDRSLMWFAALVGVWRWRCSFRTDWKTPTTPAWCCTIHATCTSPASALG